MKDLSQKAKVFILGVIALGTLFGVYNLVQINHRGFGLLILAALASVVQVLKVEGSTHKSSYNISWLVYGFTLFLMGAPATFFVILVSHLVEWAWHKYPWYIQIFNIANYAIAVTAAGVVHHLIDPGLNSPSLLGALATLAALAVFTFINHTLVGLVIWVARGQNFSQSGVFGFLTVMIDFTLIGLGTVTALVWDINPFMTVFALIPIYLIYSTLQVPALQRQTEIDPKTKLYNARYFAEALKKELDRATRFNRPLSVVLGDLDLLRNINNTYGHLAGDVVLVGVAEILQEKFRGYDLVARFGGEEFAILMPETTPEEAFPRIEEVREAIEAAEFEVSTSVTPIKATISFGVAGRNGIKKTADEIIHDADVTLYRAKLIGRNATCIYSSEGIEEFFGTNSVDGATLNDQPLKSRLEAPPTPFQPNPLRDQGTKGTEKPEDPPAKRKPNPLWWVNAYIGMVSLTAIGLAILSLILFPAPDWYGLVTFSLMILLTEGLSIDIYVKDTSVSTASAPLIAGTLLYGPVGALVLSLVLAATTMIKHRSKISRFIFNSSNHFISSSMCAFVVMLTPMSFTAQPVYLQVTLAILSGSIVFFCSTLLLSGVMSLSMGEPFCQVWQERFRWLWPFYIAFGVAGYVLVLGYTTAGVIGLVAVLVPVLALRFSQIQYIENTKANVNKLHTKNEELENQSLKIENLNEELLLSLANVIDLRDTYTMGHSNGVAEYADQIARELGFTSERMELMRKASLLHDIGKIGIPDAILFKPGPLTHEEFEVIKGHSGRGADIVGSNRSLRELTPIIRHHHERYDGQGYPDGLQGQEIPLEARILCVADSIQAMSSDRPYRKAMSLPDIIAELKENNGTQFDPMVVKAALKIMGRGEVISNAAVTHAQPIMEPELVELKQVRGGL
ncbi:MAG: diguanylate cyclase [Anaerolineales bacterium]|jgi:diguanylate cyclase (GGDEF)-like protein/putative nucleotidyltransferase with HDIG domain